MKVNKRVYIWISIIFIIFGTLKNSAADTNVSGFISVDTTWTLANSPYIVTGSVIVNSGMTLTIEPGVTIKFDSGKALQIEGTLIAKGTSSSKITFTKNSSSNWGYILFSSSSTDASYDSSGNYTSGCIMEYCIVEYAGGTSVSNNGAVRTNNANPCINYCTIRNNSATGIYAYYADGTLKITNCTITNNTASGRSYYVGNYLDGGGGIYCYSSSGGTITISNNIIDSNIVNATDGYGASGGGGIYCYSGGTITISKNIITNNKTYNSTNSNTGSGGGGIKCYNGASNSVITITNNIISDNTAPYAGGINYYRYTFYTSPPGSTITNNHIIRNTGSTTAAIDYDGSNKDFKYNTITGNKVTETGNTRAVYINALPLFNYNNIFGNTTAYELYNGDSYSSSRLDAKNNWWGAANDSGVQNKIYDYIDDVSRGSVDYSPYSTDIRYDCPISPPTGLTATAGNGQIALSWTANSESDTKGYKVYWDTDSGHSYTNSIDVGNVTSYTITGLTSSKYYVTVTAYDSSYATASDDNSTIVNENQTNGNESWYAEEKTVLLTGGVTPTPTPNATTPTVTTGTYQTVTSTSVKLFGTVNPNGASTTGWFEWGATSSYGNKTNEESLGGGTSVVQMLHEISGLSSGTTYHFRAVGKNSAGTSYGADMSFTTEAPAATKPTVTTKAATSVSSASATLNGTINPNGASTTGWFEWGTTASYGNTTQTFSGGSGTSDVTMSWSISGLSPNTTYHFKAVGQNSAGTSYGSDMSFTTSGSGSIQPTVTTGTYQVISSSSAYLFGTVNPNGLSVTGWFQWGETTSYGNTTNEESLGSGTDVVQMLHTISGLSANTTYHFRAVGKNSAGTSYGDDMTFTMPASTTDVPPTVTSKAATSVSSSSATLNGTVNPNGASTTGWFEWGTTASYGNTTSTFSGGSGTSDVTMSWALTSLSPKTTYHFRVVAQNSAGTSYGSDMSFTTSSSGAQPTVTTGTATDIMSSSATINGTVNANGLSTTAEFVYRLSGSYSRSWRTSKQTVSGSSDTSVGIGISGLTPGTSYYFRIEAENSAGRSYGKGNTFTTLKVSATPTPSPTPTTKTTPTPAACTDSYEPNDSSSTAYGPLSSGSSYNGKICTDSDVDWFKVDITGAGAISLNLTVPPSQDYDLELYDPSYSWVAGSTNSAGTSESVSYDIKSTGAYYIRIFGYNGSYNTSDSYTLTYTFTASASDTTRPTISSTSPSSGDTGVAINTAINATFSEDMDDTTINTSTFTLNNGVTGTVSYDSTTRTATFTTSSILSFSTTYTATITTGVKDISGNAMSADYTWSFTTNEFGLLANNCRLTSNGLFNCFDAVDSTDLGDKKLLILIHGWNPASAPASPLTDSWDNFIAYFSSNTSLKSAYKLYTFSYYSNSVSIKDIASSLRDILDDMNANDSKFGSKPIVIIGHSMGGLIGRYFMTLKQNNGSYSGKLGGERVLRLITLGTPHHGTPMANGPAMEEKAGKVMGPIIELFDLYFYHRGLSYLEVNRSELRWDNYDDSDGDGVGLLDYNKYSEERDSFLNDLNSNTTYDNKIVAYAGKTSNVYEPFALKYYYGYLILKDLMTTYGNDGIVPVNSAQFDGHEVLATRNFSGYNHTEMVEGKGANDTTLFGKISQDISISSTPTGVIAAEVSIKPETINLRRKGKFKAYISLPSPYSVDDVAIDTVKCEGARAIGGKTDASNRYIASFRIRDLDLPSGNYENVKKILTVSGELGDGNKFEGSDAVKVKGTK